MRELRIGPLDAGQRLDKYLMRCFKEADKGFLYRMLRKKNITRNGAKASGSEHLETGDVIQVFFSEETFLKMQGDLREKDSPMVSVPRPVLSPGSILFENDHLLIVNKPAGLLSQKAAPGDDSLTDRIAAYVRAGGGPVSRGYTPSLANRLDRNTSGLVLAGKTLPGQQLLSYLLRSRRTEKYYSCLAKGSLPAPADSLLYWSKDEEKNRADLSAEPREGAAPVRLKAEAQAHLEGGIDLLRVQLISGKSHQIRAQLAYLGHPILGDSKYGEAALNKAAAEYCGIPLSLQLLHSREVVFPQSLEEEGLSESVKQVFREVSGRRFTAPYPLYFRQVIKALGGDYGQ